MSHNRMKHSQTLEEDIDRSDLAPDLLPSVPYYRHVLSQTYLQDRGSLIIPIDPLVDIYHLLWSCWLWC